MPNSEDITAAVREHRCLTLTGRRWRGRPVWRWAADLSMSFPTGCGVFELAGVTDAAAVPDAVAAVLGPPSSPAGRGRGERPPHWRAGQVAGVDNCEHVLDAVADRIEAILAQSAAVPGLGHQP